MKTDLITADNLVKEMIEKQDKLIDYGNRFLSCIWRELSVYKSKMLVPENVVLSYGKCFDLQNSTVITCVDPTKPITIFGIPVLRSNDLEDNEFKIVVKLP